MGFLKKPAKGPDRLTVVEDVTDQSMADRYPALMEFLNVDVWEDGTPRQTGTMFLFLELGRWKLMFKDREAGAIAFFTADSLTEMFELVDKLLQDGKVAWKADRKPAGRGRAT